MAGILEGGEGGGYAGAFVGDGKRKLGVSRGGLDGVAVDDDGSFGGGRSGIVHKLW